MSTAQFGAVIQDYSGNFFMTGFFAIVAMAIFLKIYNYFVPTSKYTHKQIVTVSLSTGLLVALVVWMNSSHPFDARINPHPLPDYHGGHW